MVPCNTHKRRLLVVVGGSERVNVHLGGGVQMSAHFLGIFGGVKVMSITRKQFCSLQVSVVIL